MIGCKLQVTGKINLKSPLFFIFEWDNFWNCKIQNKFRTKTLSLWQDVQLPWIELFSDFSPLCSLHKCFYLRLGNHASSEAGGPHSNVSKFHHSLWTFLKGGGQTSLRISKLLLQGLRGFHFFYTTTWSRRSYTGEVKTLLRTSGAASKVLY